MGWRGWLLPGFVDTTATMRSAFGNGRPLNNPALTIEKTVVLRPMPSPSVRTATSDKVGYLTSIRTPERRSASRRFICTQDEESCETVQQTAISGRIWSHHFVRGILIGADLTQS